MPVHCARAPDDHGDASESIRESSREAEASEEGVLEPIMVPQRKQKSKHSDLWRNGRLYDSQRGVTCHWCRQKTVQDSQVTCTLASCRQGLRGRAKLPNTFCGPCLRNRHGEDAAACAATGSWVCPPCRVSCGPGCPACCNCGHCRAKVNLPATGKSVHQAQRAGFNNVHDWLVHLETGEDADAIAARKAQRNWGAVNSPAGNATGPGAHQGVSSAGLLSSADVSVPEESKGSIATEQQGAAAAPAKTATATAAAANAKDEGAGEAGQWEDVADREEVAGVAEGGAGEGSVGAEDAADREDVAGVAGGSGWSCGVRGAEGAAASMPGAAGGGVAFATERNNPECERPSVSGMAHVTALVTPQGANVRQHMTRSTPPGATNAKGSKRVASGDACDAPQVDAGCEGPTSPIRKCRLADHVEDQQGVGHKRRRVDGEAAGPPEG